MLDLIDEPTVARVDERPQLRVEAEPAVLLADEVDDRERRLVLVLAKAATDLLRQDGGGLRGTKQEHRVHRRHVDALAENVDAEDAAEVALLESSQGRVAFRAVGLAPERCAREAAFGEGAGHVLGVVDGDAEAERAHLTGVEQDAVKRSQERA